MLYYCKTFKYFFTYKYCTYMLGNMVLCCSYWYFETFIQAYFDSHASRLSISILTCVMHLCAKKTLGNESNGNKCKAVSQITVVLCNTLFIKICHFIPFCNILKLFSVVYILRNVSDTARRGCIPPGLNHLPKLFHSQVKKILIFPFLEVRVIRSCVTQLERLDPELVPAILACQQHPHDKAGLDHLRLLKREWANSVDGMVNMLDEITDAKAFIKVSGWLFLTLPELNFVVQKRFFHNAFKFGYSDTVHANFYVESLHFPCMKGRFKYMQQFTHNIQSFPVVTTQVYIQVNSGKISVY